MHSAYGRRVFFIRELYRNEKIKGRRVANKFNYVLDNIQYQNFCKGIPLLNQKFFPYTIWLDKNLGMEFVTYHGPSDDDIKRLKRKFEAIGIECKILNIS